MKTIDIEIFSEDCFITWNSNVEFSLSYLNHWLVIIHILPVLDTDRIIAFQHQHIFIDIMLLAVTSKKLWN